MNRPTEQDYKHMADWLYKAFGKAEKGHKLKDVKEAVSNYLEGLVYDYRGDLEARERDINKVVAIWMKMS